MKPWTEDRVFGLLARRYSTPQYALVRGVRSAPGFNDGGLRTIDAVAIGLWKSRGYHVHSIEIKVDRRDWLRELKSPEKAEQIVLASHRFSVCTPEGVIKDGELPHGWGHLLATPRGISVVRESVLRAPEVHWGWVVSILRRSFEQAPGRKEREEIRAEGFEAGAAEEREKHATLEGRESLAHELATAKRSVESWKRQAQGHKDDIDAFEKSSGVSIRYGVAAEVGALLKLVRLHGKGWMIKDLQRRVRDLVDEAGGFSEALDAYAAGRAGKGGAS